MQPAVQNAAKLKEALVAALLGTTHPEGTSYNGVSGLQKGNAKLAQLKREWAGNLVGLVSALRHREVPGVPAPEQAWLLWRMRTIAKLSQVDKTGWGV